MFNLKTALAATVLLGTGMAALPASALPMDAVAPVIATSRDLANNIQDVRWVCGPYRCHWAPNYDYGYGPGPRWGGGLGWRHRHWRRW